MTEEQIKFLTYAVWLNVKHHHIPDIDFLLESAKVGITGDNWKVMNEFLKELEESDQKEENQEKKESEN